MLIVLFFLEALLSEAAVHESATVVHCFAGMLFLMLTSLTKLLSLYYSLVTVCDWISCVTYV
jgi:hypothetical protein